jgi:hypothetical protein
MVTKEQVIERIKGCREQVNRLLEIAPDTVPAFLKKLAMDEEGIESRLDKEEEGKSEAAKAVYYMMIDAGISSITKELERFEADLQRRIQPEGEPRIKRKFKNFKKRKGTW